MLEKDLEQLENFDAEAEATVLRLQPDVVKACIAGWALNRDAIDAMISNLSASGRVRTYIVGGNSAKVAATFLEEHGDARLQIEAVDAYDMAAAPSDYAVSGAPVLVVAMANGHAKRDEILTEAVAQLASTNTHVSVLALGLDSPALERYVSDHAGMAAHPDPAVPAEAYKGAKYIAPLFMTLLALDGEEAKIVAHRAEVTKMMVESIVMREGHIAKLVTGEYPHIVFHGTGALASLADYAKKVFDKTLGDKFDVVAESAADIAGDPDWADDTCLVMFMSSEPDQREEQLSFIKHVKDTGKAAHVVAIQQDIKPMFVGSAFSFDGFPIIGDGYLAVPFALVVRVLARMLAVKCA